MDQQTLSMAIRLDKSIQQIEAVLEGEDQLINHEIVGVVLGPTPYGPNTLHEPEILYLPYESCGDIREQLKMRLACYKEQLAAL